MHGGSSPITNRQVAERAKLNFHRLDDHRNLRIAQCFQLLCAFVTVYCVEITPFSGMAAEFRNTVGQCSQNFDQAVSADRVWQRKAFGRLAVNFPQ